MFPSSAGAGQIVAIGGLVAGLAGLILSLTSDRDAP
jgi:hypothetical protein